MDWFDEKLKNRLNKPEKEIELENAGYEYLGWQINSHPKVMRCYKELGHRREDYSKPPTHEYPAKDMQHNPRGSDCTYWCDECRYYYKIDMSD